MKSLGLGLLSVSYTHLDVYKRQLYTSDGDAHKDLFQEITIQLWKAFPKFRGDAKFSTWAYRVALNLSLIHI